MPTVFCHPVAIGGPVGVGLDFPAWPILVPGREGDVQMCYTNDEQFRDTYLQRGFCGLDTSFRAQFDYECPEQQIIQVAPTGAKRRGGHRWRPTLREFLTWLLNRWVTSLLSLVIVAAISDIRARLGLVREARNRDSAGTEAGRTSNSTSSEGSTASAALKAQKCTHPRESAAPVGMPSRPPEHDARQGDAGSQEDTDDVFEIDTPSSMDSSDA
jgi:hypothetical protein